jgi:hypothetical protein
MKIHRVPKNPQLMISFFMLWLSTIAYAASPEASIASQLNGEWISPRWHYGFRIDGKSGYATQWNNKYNPNDKTREGDVILKIDEYTSKGFIGRQQFFSGKMVPVVVNFIDAKTIKLEAGPEVWEMVRP